MNIFLTKLHINIFYPVCKSATLFSEQRNGVFIIFISYFSIFVLELNHEAECYFTRRNSSERESVILYHPFGIY